MTSATNQAKVLALPDLEARSCGSKPAITAQLVYPCTIEKKVPVVLDRVCESMYYLWFNPELAHDMILIRIQKVCREMQQESGGKIHIDNGYIEQGRIVLRLNLAMPDDGGKALWRSILEATKVLCTTTDVRERSSFLSEMYSSTR